MLDQEEEQNLKSGATPLTDTHSIEFKDVTFGYSREDDPTIHQVSVKIPAGKTVAFVGETGAGKSTVFNLLTGFYQPWEGHITLGDEPIATLSKEWLRQKIGYVTQENFLFNTSVRDNLLLANPKASDEELWAALQSANASQFVQDLPQGLDTVTGERGSRLSGGEKQRISIARALLKNPPVLLLDEATSAVDNETERLIQASLDNLRKNRTCLVIAHRLSTIVAADIICVMRAGKIIEQGTHEELLKLNGNYAELVSK